MRTCCPAYAHAWRMEIFGGRAERPRLEKFDDLGECIESLPIAFCPFCGQRVASDVLVILEKPDDISA